MKNRIIGGKVMEKTLERMLKTLEKKVRPEHTALLIIDMQNDFCSIGGMFDREGYDVRLLQEITPRLLNLIEKARKVGVVIIFVKNVQSGKVNYLSDVWLEQSIREWKGGRYIHYAVCEQGSWGGDFYEGFIPSDSDFIVRKHRYGAFESTDLELILKSNDIRTLIITGAATNICVETTIRQAFMKEYYVVVPEDCVASLNKEMHENSLFTINKWFGQVVTSADIFKYW